MTRKIIFILSGALMAGLAFVSWPLPALASSADAGVAKTSLGKIVVDGKGMSAYFFDHDEANSGTSTCTGQCAVIWPAIIAASDSPNVSGITGKIGILAGSKQLTINGRPIYTYLYDTAPGSTKGQGINRIWYVVSPSGEELKSPTPSPKTLKPAKANKPVKSVKKPKPAKVVRPGKSPRPSKSPEPRTSSTSGGYSRGNY
jgi:predicted lipoprotein with Yx(FWY)xxD motif